MTVEMLRDILFEMIQGYFAGATVKWGEHNSTKPSSPFIRLKLGSLRRPQHFINQSDKNASRSYIPSTTLLTVELFTHGRKVPDEEGDFYYVNTSMDDMADFVNYMVSPEADDVYMRNDISVRPEGDIKNTTAVLDSDYEYRAMQEFIVDFIQESNGYAGIMRDNWEPTPSGGGTEELASKPIYDIDCNDVDINSQEE